VFSHEIYPTNVYTVPENACMIVDSMFYLLVVCFNVFNKNMSFIEMSFI
jgi:hypothetical protein